jgi:ubiquinone/menaquinone biosynthesis C-methylase UbiE
MLRLNLASGTDIRDGWVNLDVVPRWPITRRGCDVIWDARKDPIPYRDGEADEIYAGYLLLHLSPRYHSTVLADIYRVLSPTGTLMVGEVDMHLVMERWLANPMDRRLSRLIWGEQGTAHDPDVQNWPEELVPYDKHCHGFTAESLAKTLRNAKFDILGRTNIHCAEVFYELTYVCRKQNA